MAMYNAIFTISKAIIPPSARQAFLPLSLPSCEALRRRAVCLAGLSELFPPYEQVRPRQNHHSLNITLGGQAHFAWPGGHMVLSAGTILVVPAGTACRFSIAARRRWRTLWFHLEDGPRWASLHDRSPHRLVSAIPAGLVGVVEQLLAESISVAPESDDAARACAQLVAIHIDRLLGPDAPSKARQEELARRLQLLWDEVDARLHEPWTVSQLAGHLEISEATLHRLCARLYQCTPLQRVFELRHRRTCELLANTHLTLDEIARHVGYATAFALSKAFKRTEGQPPAAYRAERQSRRSGRGSPFGRKESGQSRSCSYNPGR